MAERLTRRTFLTLSAAAAAGLAGTPALAATHKVHKAVAAHRSHGLTGAGHNYSGLTRRVPALPQTPERFVQLVNAHTNESLDAVYWRDGAYIPDTMHRINRVLRDHLSGDVHTMDPRLIDLLGELRRTMGVSEPFSVISGYRSPRTNAWMARTERGVAAHSLHIKGQAADIELPGYDISTLHNTALAMAEGGVGYYPRSGFVHVDTGKPREWEFG